MSSLITILDIWCIGFFYGGVEGFALLLPAAAHFFLQLNKVSVKTINLVLTGT